MPKEIQIKLMLLNLCREIRAIIVVFLTCPNFVSNDKALLDMSSSLVQHLREENLHHSVEQMTIVQVQHITGSTKPIQITDFLLG
jgi:hypothetical protein